MLARICHSTTIARRNWLKFLGSMAPNDKSGDDNRRLGFQVDGNIAMDNSSDVRCL